MTFFEMKSRIRQRLNQSTTAFFNDADLNRAINEGYAEMADATDFYEREAQVPLLKRRIYYDLSTLLEDVFLTPRRMYNPATSQWLTPTNPLEMDRQYAQWELVTGEPQKYLLRGNWQLGVFPKPTADSVSGLRFYYSSIPPALSDDSDTPAFPEEFHQGLIDYALCDLIGQQRETKKALGYWAKYEVHETSLTAYANDRNRLAQLKVL